MLSRAWMIACLLCASAPACADDDAGIIEPVSAADTSGVPKIGLVHDALRRGTQRHTVSQEMTNLYGDYSRFKTRFQQETGLTWNVDATLTQQWGVPDGGSPALSVLGGLSANYELFRSPTVGAGSLQFLGYYNSYLTRANAADVQSNLGLITPINDWPINQSVLYQLTYTQTLPGNRLSISVGQYPFQNFDNNQYLANSQLNFINYIFSQNGSATYAAAGHGAFAQWNATNAVQFAAGFQFPNSDSIATRAFEPFQYGDLGWFGYAQWTPKFTGLGAAQYSLTWQESPAVKREPTTHGWSLNAVQNLNDVWAVFGRANGAGGFTTRIRASYALGVAMNNRYSAVRRIKSASRSV